jgi:hypothetical protein
VTTLRSIASAGRRSGLVLVPTQIPIERPVAGRFAFFATLPSIVQSSVVSLSEIATASPMPSG